MPLAPDLRGRAVDAPPFSATADAIAEFAAATGASYAGGDAPAMFGGMVALSALRVLTHDPATGMEPDGLVHGEQELHFLRLVRVDDVLHATATVESVRRATGADVVAVRCTVTDGQGETVVTSRSVLLHKEVQR